MEKNPLLAGLFNVLLPGSRHIYIEKEWRKFILIFFGAILLLAALIWLGSGLQSARYFGLPQGLCPGLLTLIVIVPLFINGYKAAAEHNNEIQNKAKYQPDHSDSQGDTDAQSQRNQRLRDSGLISQEQYDTEKGRIDAKE
jgi:hypothetical protein